MSAKSMFFFSEAVEVVLSFFEQHCDPAVGRLLGGSQ